MGRKKSAGKKKSEALEDSAVPAAALTSTSVEVGDDSMNEEYSEDGSRSRSEDEDDIRSVGDMVEDEDEDVFGEDDEFGEADENDEVEGEDEDEDDSDLGIEDDEYEGVSGDELSGAEELGDTLEGVSGSEAEDEHEGNESGDSVAAKNAFGRAFGNIMKKKVPKTGLTETLGPVLAERKQLLLKKLEEEDIENKAKIVSKKEKRESREKGHTVPQTYTDGKEKALIKLATTGVVRLFNAVSKAQKVQADADISSHRSAKATLKSSKVAFMTQLRGATSGSGDKQPNGSRNIQRHGEEDEAGWSALKSDFMLGTSKLKDWDKDPEKLLPLEDN